MSEQTLSINEKNVEQQRLYRYYRTELSQKLKKEFGPSKNHFKEPVVSSSDLKLPLRSQDIRQTVMEVVALFVFFALAVFYDDMRMTLINEGTKFGIALVLSTVMLIDIGIFPRHMSVHSDYLKLGWKKVRWQDVHRIGFLKNHLNSKNKEILEIWYGEVPEVFKLKVSGRYGQHKLRQAIETMCREKNISFYEHTLK
jgi:hypothetical protein